MDENAVVASVCRRLETMGCEITQRRTTKEHGVDIIAHDKSSGQQFLIEAKGGTSSREGSNRFGKPYTQSQVFDRVAKGVFTCLQLRAEHPDHQATHVILALPDARGFRSYVTPILGQLRSVGIEVWFEPFP